MRQVMQHRGDVNHALLEVHREKRLQFFKTMIFSPSAGDHYLDFRKIANDRLKVRQMNKRSIPTTRGAEGIATNTPVYRRC